ncbi:hypothetical protein [Archangium lansingense]|uniref:Lipoprotein n=1 Tax=Archangium lansingense TaxID=2995310 RepID=A0ABT4A640_9BACT|nr:hypothetical protein [Archangium lansinium]MCY1077131.1 hypothetical protein [Archangium lansinium]
MRVLQSLVNPCLAAVFALVLPLAQAQAQQCVSYRGLDHCALGTARLSLQGSELRADGGSTSGKDGIAINTGLATTWTASTQLDYTNGSTHSLLLTSVSDGAPTSTATIQKQGDLETYSATFSGTGAESTFSVLVYRDGVLQAAVSGVRNGQFAARAQRITDPNDQNRTNKTPKPRNTFHVLSTGACEWTIEDEAQIFQLANGKVVQGNRIVLTEELRGPGSYPYFGFDQILLQSTSKSVTFIDTSVVSAK